MKKLVLCLLFSVCFSFLKAQTNYKANSLYLNMLGDGAAISINYDRILLKRNAFFISGKFGWGLPNMVIQGAGQGDREIPTGVTLTQQVSINFGSKSSFFQLGGGGVFLKGQGESCYHFFPTIAYRYQPQTEGLMLRLMVHPVNTSKGTCKLFVPLGIAMGYTF